MNKTRHIILDTETTGLVNARLVSIGMLEMVDGQLTGKSVYKVVNPEVTMDQQVINIHHITNEMAQAEPVFAAYAKEVRDFIGDSPVVITCRVSNGVTLDIDVLNRELAKAGEREVPLTQWVNIRLWSQAMWGNDQARLDAVLDRYGVSRVQRDAEGHGALLDAQLLAAVFPKVQADYAKFKSQPKPPTP